MDKRSAVERDCAELCFAVDQVCVDARECPEGIVSEWLQEAAEKLNALLAALRDREAA